MPLVGLFLCYNVRVFCEPINKKMNAYKKVVQLITNIYSEMMEIRLKNIMWKMRTEKKETRKITDIIYSRFP